MLKILYNSSSDSPIKGKIVIRDSYLSVTAKNKQDPTYGTDSVEAMRSYNSYVFSRERGSKVKNFRTITGSDYKFLDMNRLGVAIKMDYTDMIQLYSEADILQVDTGIICGTERDIIIRVFEGMKDSFEVDADMEVEVGTFDSKTLPQGSHPRMTLWDSYGLTINGLDFAADRKDIILTGDSSVPLVPDENGVLTLTIQKYKGAFGEKLTRPIDNEEVLLDSSCGLLETRRVALVNGKATVRLFTFGYTGPFKLKLGRKWYEVWNDYSFIMGKAK